MSGDPVHARRLRAQLLAGTPARDPLAVAEQLLAIQGQDPRGARLAIRARSRGLRAVDVDHALTEQRSLLITWLNRGTLHLVGGRAVGLWRLRGAAVQLDPWVELEASVAEALARDGGALEEFLGVS